MPDHEPSWWRRKGRLRRDILWILALALAVRCVCFAFSMQDPAGRQCTLDSGSYIILADNLLKGNGFGRTYSDGDEPAYWLPELCRTPGYPVIYAFFQRVTGNGQTATILLQLLLGMIMCLLGMFTAEKFWGTRAGQFAGLWLALDMQGITIANMMMTESLSGTILFFAMLGCVIAVSRSSPTWGLLSGLTMGLATLIRPTSIVLPTLAALLIVIWAFRGRSKRLGFTALAVFMGGNLIHGAWIVRNGVVCGEYAISSIPRFQLIAGHATRTVMRATGKSELVVKNELFQELGFSRTHVRRKALSREDQKRLGTFLVDTIQKYPRAFVEDFTLRTINMVAGPDKDILVILGYKTVDFGLLSEAQDYDKQPPATSYMILGVQVLMLALLYGLALATIWDMLRKRQSHHLLWIALLFSATGLILSAGAPGNPRYRWPSIPPLVVLAAASAHRLPPRRVHNPTDGMVPRTT